MHKLVVHCKRSGYQVYIGRPGPWGNPFTMTGKSDAARFAALAKYCDWLANSPEPQAQWVRDNVEQLVDKVLACWCAPRHCHGDVLAELAQGHIGDRWHITRSKYEFYIDQYELAVERGD